MSPLDILCLSYYAVFVGLHILLMFGIFLEWLRENKTLKSAAFEAPSVSVIIPVHNEDSRISGLLQSLKLQDYPNVEYIFVDDRSIDNSAELLEKFVQEKKLYAKIISLAENPGPNNKQYALARGIEASAGDFILFTDADCIVPPLWIRGMVMHLSNKKTGAVIGPVFKCPENASFTIKNVFKAKYFLHLYQCFEHGIRYTYLAGASGLGAAGGGFGNNLIISRRCLDAVGGYENVPPSPTEDAALISKIRSCSDYKIRAALGSNVHVITQGENTWEKLINQTLRWNNGGLFSPDSATRFNYNFLMITIGMGVIALPLLPFLPSLWPLPFGVLTSMVFNTIANLSLFGVSLPTGKLGYILTMLFTPVYFTFLTILGFAGIKPEWKGKRV